jgi:OPA family glycerol-3-phosphate transporter-like MFS transporter
MKLFYARELDAYPRAARRAWLLAMAVLATLVASYEASISPVLPLLLKDLKMSLTTYGLIAAASVVAGAASAYWGGRYADRWGRVTLLIPVLLLTGVVDFAMVLVHNPGELLIARCVLSFIEGAGAATTAGLVRDFSPRVGRSTAFGFWTWGPVGANYLAAAIAGLTLPIFVVWQSQFIIIGTISVVLSLVIAFNIADLAPALRARVIHTASEGEELTAEPHEHVEIGRTRALLSHPHIWAHLLGISSWLVLYETLVLYGPTMLVQSFHLTVATAANVMSAFWVLNLGSLIIAGIVSDRLKLRKPVSLVGAIFSTITIIVLVSQFGATTSGVEVAIIGAILGAFLGVTYAPWMAGYSENTEDIRASLQGTAWGLYGLFVRVMVIGLAVIAPIVVAATAGWRTWMIVAIVFEALYIPAIFAFQGPWRRAAVEQRLATPA